MAFIICKKKIKVGQPLRLLIMINGQESPNYFDGHSPSTVSRFPDPKDNPITSIRQSSPLRLFSSKTLFWSDPWSKFIFIATAEKVQWPLGNKYLGKYFCSSSCEWGVSQTFQLLPLPAPHCISYLLIPTHHLIPSLSAPSSSFLIYINILIAHHTVEPFLSSTLSLSSGWGFRQAVQAVSSAGRSVRGRDLSQA